MKNFELTKELFQLNNFVTKVLVENIDEETGEIKDDDVFQFLQAADQKKSDLISTATLSYFHYKDLAAHVEKKLARYRSLKNDYLQFENTLKNILTKFIDEGQTIETDDFRISWRKSQIVEKDLFLDFEDFSKKFPDLVKITYELKKNDIKRIAKTGILPEGIKLVSKNNIQIK